MASPRVLFVDDDPNVREAIRRSLHDQAGEWEMLFAANGVEALDIMTETPVHVVVTDIAMPVMDGKTLITHLYESFPEVVTLVLSGHWTPSMSYRQVGPGIRFLAKPASRQSLVDAVREAVAEVRLTMGEPSSPARPPQGLTPSSLTPPKPDGGWVDLVERGT